MFDNFSTLAECVLISESSLRQVWASDVSQSLHPVIMVTASLHAGRVPNGKVAKSKAMKEVPFSIIYGDFSKNVDGGLSCRSWPTSRPICSAF